MENERLIDMKIYGIKALLCALVCAIEIPTATLMADEGGTTIDYLQASDYWPESVTLVRDVMTTDGVSLKQGRSGVLIRAENGELVVDFGRYGVVHLSPSDTDFYERAPETKPDKDGQWALFSRYVSRAFCDPDTRKQCQPGQYDQSGFYAVFYTDFGGPEWTNSASLIHALTPTLLETKSIGVQPLIVPMDSSIEEMSEDMEETGVPAPTMMFFLSKGYQLAWDHHPEQWPVVVIDRNGYVITKLSAEELKETAAARTKIENAVLSYEHNNDRPSAL